MKGFTEGRKDGWRAERKKKEAKKEEVGPGRETQDMKDKVHKHN